MTDPIAHLDFEPNLVRLLAEPGDVVVQYHCAGCGQLVTAAYRPGNLLDPVAACSACGVLKYL